MKIIMGSGVKGYALKEAVKAHLQSRGHEVIDVGCHKTDVFVKYSAIGQRVAEAMQQGEAPLAINCCGSGTGASIATNKFRGVCAVSCESVETARLSRVVNDANVLCMGESIVAPELGCAMADAFIGAVFQDAPGTPQPVLDFWAEARDELMARGETALPRDIEIVEM